MMIWCGIVGTYYVYFNPCGIVNNVNGASQNASAWGNWPKVPGSNDIIFGTSRIQTSFADPQDPAGGMMQLYISAGFGCYWGRGSTSHITTGAP